MDFHVRPANPNEAPIAFELLYEAALWLNRKGIDYWQNWLDPSKEFQNWILTGFQASQFYFVEIDSEIAGMFRLQESDSLFWGARSDKAIYIHSLTTRRTLAGKGLGYKILSYIQELAITSGNEFLRLDCGIEVPALCSYYKQFGFMEIDKVQVDRYKLVLFEKKLII